MEYDYIKSLHLIFVITWFAGYFTIVRLFVYQIEAYEKASPAKEILGDQLKIMAKRLWYIYYLAFVVFGSWLCNLASGAAPFLYTRALDAGKLGFVVALICYHIKCHLIFKDLQNDVVKHSGNFMRIFNEGATFILFAVVFW